MLAIVYDFFKQCSRACFNFLPKMKKCSRAFFWRAFCELSRPRKEQVKANKSNSLSTRAQNQARRVIEQNAHTLVTQLIAEAVLVRVVDPLADPQHGHTGRILGVVHLQRLDLGRLDHNHLGEFNSLIVYL